jgi:hypothetical protein
MKREKGLILKGSPCAIDYFDKNLLTIQQAIAKGRTYCPSFQACDNPNNSIYCALRSGLEVAQHVVNGSTLEQELKEFSEADFLNGKFRNSLDGKEFYIDKGKAKFIGAVEKFARTVLLIDTSESVFPQCEKCNGVKLNKTVYDSIHDGPFPLSGSGKTLRRDVEYCPDCDPEPRGGFLKEDPRDAEDIALIMKFKKQNE